MKPRNRRLAKYLFPAFIVLPAMASAAVITPDGFGNVTVNNPATDNGPNNIVTGPTPPAGPRTIFIGAGIILTPTGADVIEVQATNASGAVYTITNNGTLTSDGGASNYGISTADLPGTTPSITVINNGAISGAGAIRANNLLTLTNNSSLTGTSGVDAAVFTKNGGTITNNAGATITGNVYGIRSENAAGTLTVTNNSSITGTNSDGINTAGALILTNNRDSTTLTASTIQGGGSGAIAGAGSQITNYGSIAGTTAFSLTSGLQVGNNSTVTNKTTFSFLTPSAGGSISGFAAGILAGDGFTFTNENLSSVLGNQDGIFAGNTANITNTAGASITGTNGDGIEVGNSAIIVNSGSISGGDNGIQAGNTANITNNLGATITASGDTAVAVGSAATILNDGSISTTDGDGIASQGGLNFTNNGTLSANEDGVDVDGDGAASTIINTGTITSTGGDGIDGDNSVQTVTNSGSISGFTTALNLGAGADVVNLNDGSSISGSVIGGADADTINFSGGLASSTDITNNIIRGNVEIEDINKSGAGVAFIGGVGDLFTVDADTIDITGGGLYINGNVSGLTGALATINAGGTALGGTGTWDADVNITAGGISAGDIPINLIPTPEDAVGTVTINGDVIHSGASFIRVDIIPGTSVNNGITSDLIVQNGVGNVYDLGTNRSLRISSTSQEGVIQDGTRTIIDSDEVILGNIGTIGVQYNANISDFGPFYGTEVGSDGTNSVLALYFSSTQFSDGGTNLDLVTEHSYADLPGLSQNQAALGGAIDAAITNGNPLVQNFINALDNSNLSAVQATLASLNPEGYLAIASGIVNSNYRLHRIVQEHLATVRSSDTVSMQVGSTTDAKGAIVPSSPVNSNRGNFWGSVSYDWQDYSGDGDDTDFDGEVGAITAGFDYRVAPSLVLGIVLDGSTADYDSNAGSSDVDSLRVLGYATWGQSTGLYSDFVAGWGNHDLDIDRNLGGILFGSNSTSADATSIQALWTIGYAFGTPTLKHGPYAGFEYQNVDVDGFDESGTLPLSVGDFDVESFRGLIGYRVSATTGRFTPYASVSYAHEFKDDGASATANFGGADFRVRGAEQGSAVVLTAGTGISLTNALSLNIGYRGEISAEDEGIDSHGGSLGLNYSF